MALTRKQWAGKVQHFERDWWGDCSNTYGEESKQIAYARVMGLDPGTWRGGDKWPNYDADGKRVIDVGGGPSSMLLKAHARFAVVVDPCEYPAWVTHRYDAHNVRLIRRPAEDQLPEYEDNAFDEAWCYNVLAHTYDPELVCRQMARIARVVRIFEWVNEAPHPGHPHELDADLLTAWLLKDGNARHVWLDEQYQEIGRESPSPVRQHAWGGVFG